MAQLEDSSGLIKAQTAAGAVARGAIFKVSKLVEEVAAFEMELYDQE